MTVQDAAISYSSNGNMSVDTYGMDGMSVGVTDQGEALYDFGGVTMTEEQAMQNMDYFESDDQDDYYNGDDTYEDSFPEVITEQLMHVNDVLGGGAAEFYADELLGIGDSRMDEVMRGTHQSREQLQSHAEATLHHMAAAVNMDGDMLAQELAKDIATVRSLGSDMATDELHAAITDAMSGDYHAAMTRWNRLRTALKSVR